MGELRKHENTHLEAMPEEECADRSERRKKREQGETIYVNMGPVRCHACGTEMRHDLMERHNCPAAYEHFVNNLERK